MSQTIQDVSDTAFWVASFRAAESKRSDALFKDPLAEILAGAKGENLAQSMAGTKYVAWTLSIRTRIIDDLVTRLAAQGFDVILNLGAGLDTRPYRLNLPSGLKWIEVDYPHVIKFKETQLGSQAPLCELQRIGLDLADATARQALFASISRSANKVAVLTEGVVPYLSNDEAASLAHDLRAVPNFCAWIVDYVDRRTVRRVRRKKLMRQLKNAPFRFAPANWHGFFANVGWGAAETHYLSEESLRLGRPIPMPLWAKILSAFMTQKKRESFLKFSAYVLLEPVTSTLLKP